MLRTPSAETLRSSEYQPCGRPAAHHTRRQLSARTSSSNLARTRRRQDPNIARMLSHMMHPPLERPSAISPSSSPWPSPPPSPPPSHPPSHPPSSSSPERSCLGRTRGGEERPRLRRAARFPAHLADTLGRYMLEGGGLLEGALQADRRWERLLLSHPIAAWMSWPARPRCDEEDGAAHSTFLSAHTWHEFLDPAELLKKPSTS